ncbi:MAG: PHP domain-containing protein [Selenomonadaceae bacterium]|nr:PHP domain-containing protein [Selenomonadaceae bacterium]MBR1860221.1 PHP domain-containing protein [Selenomonadaceae bacterium]
MASDLHTHTIFSDGSFSPEELIAAAKKIGLSYLGITDHDTVDGIAHLYENGLYPNKSINIIPGIEFSASNPDHDIHIVGYNIDIYNGNLLDKLNDVIEARWTRFSEILDKLQSNGLSIKETDVLKIAGTSRSIGRSHIARALVRNGCFKTVREAFDKMLQKGKPAYVPRYLLELEEIIELIHRAGGTAVLAHPKLIGDDNLVEEICTNHHIDAIEAFYPKHTVEDTNLYIETAKKFNLLITGGSDFHGTTSRYVKDLGEFTIEDKFAEQFYIESTV